MDTIKVTRFELIMEERRSVVEYDCEVELSLQDDGKTLKVFLKRNKQELIPVIESLWDTTVHPIGFKFRYDGDVLELAEATEGCKGCTFRPCGFVYPCFRYQRLNDDGIIFKKINQ